MCIIVAKKRGIPIPSNFAQILRNCFAHNRDGAGMMIKRKGVKKILVCKGYMTINSLMNAFDDLKVTAEDEFVLHCRIATQGRVNPNNCHPFVVTKDKTECDRVRGLFEKPCVAHNGGFGEFGHGRDDPHSDTFYFTNELLSKWNDKMGNRKLGKFRKRLRKAIGTWNKLAIIYPDQEMELLGSFTYNQGIFYSSGGWQGNGVSSYGSDEEEFESAYCGL